MDQRDCFLGKARKKNHSQDWSKHRYYRNCASNKIKKAYAARNRCLIKESGNDHNTFWRTLKKDLTWRKKKAASPSISIDGILNSGKGQIANAFNKFFTGAATRVLECIPSCCCKVKLYKLYFYYSATSTRVYKIMHKLT